MPVQAVPGTSFRYYLVAFDAEGIERDDDPDGRISERSAQALEDDAVTDVFVVSHGWQSDIPYALDQYNRWLAAMLAVERDVAHAKRVRDGFRPLVIGFHWPSLPFGDEELARAATFAPGRPTALQVDRLVDAYAARLVDTPQARAMLRVIVEAASTEAPQPALPPELREAYLALDREIALGAQGPAAAPGSDREPFDPDRLYSSGTSLGARTFGGGGLGSRLLAPLRALSFWRMKDRGRRLGEGCGAQLLARLQRISERKMDVRFHLVGHSFGCIVVSAMAKGAEGKEPPRPVHSLTLLQGALSIWSYSSAVPGGGTQPGYFRPLITERRVRGPILTTHSQYDSAVGRLYPLAAGAARQVTYARRALPKYGALGAFGAQGEELGATSIAMLDAADQYPFAAGGLYNLESSAYICEGAGVSGAHNDVARPQVAHAVWQAALTAI